jgi:hypothetical protein
MPIGRSARAAFSAVTRDVGAAEVFEDGKLVPFDEPFWFAVAALAPPCAWFAKDSRRSGRDYWLAIASVLPSGSLNQAPTMSPSLAMPLSSVLNGSP